MIADYKLYHGAAIAELIQSFSKPIRIRSIGSTERLINYELQGKIGLQIRHATQALHPWHFTFLSDHVLGLRHLIDYFPIAYVILVCKTDGTAAVPASKVLANFEEGNSQQCWIRADRKSRQLYRLYGPGGEFDDKYPVTLAPIVQELRRLESENC